MHFPLTHLLHGSITRRGRLVYTIDGGATTLLSAAGYAETLMLYLVKRRSGRIPAHLT